MDETVKITIMALLQGLTEFLPISSSGHLAIFGNILGLDPDGSLELVITLHAGTLLAIVLYYFKELFTLVKPSEFKMVLKIITGTIPAGVIGLALHKTGIADALFSNIYMSAAGLIITGFILKRTSQIHPGMIKCGNFLFYRRLLLGYHRHLQYCLVFLAQELRYPPESKWD